MISLLIKWHVIRGFIFVSLIISEVDQLDFSCTIGHTCLSLRISNFSQLFCFILWPFKAFVFCRSLIYFVIQSLAKCIACKAYLSWTMSLLCVEFSLVLFHFDSILFVCLFSFCNRVMLCSPDWHCTYYAEDWN